MVNVTVRVEEYNALDLVARARLTLYNLILDGLTASSVDIELARENQIKALAYICDNRALVKAGRLDKIYADLVVLAHEAECVAEMRNRTTLRGLQDKLSKLGFGFAQVFSVLEKLVIDEAKGG